LLIETKQWSEKLKKKMYLIEFEPYLLKIAVFEKAKKAYLAKNSLFMGLF